MNGPGIRRCSPMHPGGCTWPSDKGGSTSIWKSGAGRLPDAGRS